MKGLTGTKPPQGGHTIERSRPLSRSERPMMGWIFAGGGARGAYEVGVCGYLFDRIARDLGPLPIDIISGTSVGALHASALAAGIDDPLAAMNDLAKRWTSLDLPDVVRVDRRRIFNMVRALFGRPPRHPALDVAGGGVLDPRPLEKLLSSAIQFRRIGTHIAAGRLTLLSLSATHLESGSTTVFYQGAARVPSPNSRRSRTRYQRVAMGAEHAMASAAIPLLFPAVPIDGELFCDGSLRQHVPLSPALQFGADALIVINPRGPVIGGPDLQGREPTFAGPLFLLGKTLNALTLDRVEGDIEQLERINRVLEAGTRRFGADFVADLNGALGAAGDRPVRPVSLLHLHASEDIGGLAAAYVRSRRFQGRAGGLARTFARLADGEGKAEADLLSYLLFDSHFTSELIALGRRDAERRHEEIATFFKKVLERRGLAATNKVNSQEHQQGPETPAPPAPSPPHEEPPPRLLRPQP